MKHSIGTYANRIQCLSVVSAIFPHPPAVPVGGSRRRLALRGGLGVAALCHVDTDVLLCSQPDRAGATDVGGGNGRFRHQGVPSRAKIKGHGFG